MLSKFFKFLNMKSDISAKNSRIENIHTFPERTMAKFMHGCEHEWDDAFPLATHWYNIAPSVDELESPFQLCSW